MTRGKKKAPPERGGEICSPLLAPFELLTHIRFIVLATGKRKPHLASGAKSRCYALHPRPAVSEWKPVTVTYLRSTTRCGLFGWIAASSDLVVVASRRARAGIPHKWRAFSSTAPATRLGRHQQVGHHDPVVDLPGFVRGPASAKAAADDENIRIHEHRFLDVNRPITSIFPILHAETAWAAPRCGVPRVRARVPGSLGHPGWAPRNQTVT